MSSLGKAESAFGIPVVLQLHMEAFGGTYATRQIPVLEKMGKHVVTNIDLKAFPPFANAYPIECHSDFPEISPRSNIR